MVQRVVSLFSGIGGFEAGFSGLPLATSLMCEIDPAASSVLTERFPGIDVIADICQLKALPECDIVVAGWPCQDLSQAGRTAGISGQQSGLIGEFFRLIDASPTKPDTIVLENVAFALSLQKGRAIHYVTEALQSRGYKWAYRILDTREFGLPQRRRRIFICASQSRLPSEILFDGIGVQPSSEPDPTHVGFY
ncbi:MAG TPA: DNA (cytosine-5-)-methyltransferase, partial [Allosphingosinicella sp.]|nr:DNA (cytosine-5-)-methyltransferase [Allosphingosinicella sp.]